MSEICERCQAKGKLIEDNANGIKVCANCGLVLEEKILADENGKRVGPPTPPEQAAEPGSHFAIREKVPIKKRMICQNGAKNEKNNLKRIHDLLSSAGVFALLIEETKNLYLNLIKVKNIQRRNLNHIIIALYYYVCLREKMAKSFKDVAKMFPPVTERQIKKAFNFIKSDIGYVQDKNEFIDIEKNCIMIYMGGKFDKYEAKILSYKILENINNNGLLKGKTPNTVAGLALMLSYKLLNYELDNNEDFFRTFSTKGAIIKAFKDIKNQLDKVIPSEFNDKIKELKKGFN